MQQWSIFWKVFFIAVEDDDFLTDVTETKGVFLVQCPGLSFIDGYFLVYKEVPENVNVLLGSTKDFEHIVIKRERGNNLKVPMGKFIYGTLCFMLMTLFGVLFKLHIIASKS